MVWIFIFTLWLVSVYALLVSSLKINDFNRNSIIASNLAREQIELLRNIRDTNYSKVQVWNQQFPLEDFDALKVFSWAITASGSYYILSHDDSWLLIDDISAWFEEGKGTLSWSSMQWYKICQIVSNGEYRDCPDTISTNEEETYFYRYLHIEDALDDVWNPIPDTFKVRSKVIWNKRWYYEFEISTLLADWRRI